MKNVKTNYTKFSNEPLDDWLEKEGLEIIIGGHEDDGYIFRLRFKDQSLRFAPHCYYNRDDLLSEYHKVWPINDDITENGIKKAIRNLKICGVRIKKEIVIKSKWLFFTKEVYNESREFLEIKAPNFKVE